MASMGLWRADANRSADSDSAALLLVLIVVEVWGSLLRPLPGIQPLSPLSMVDVAVDGCARSVPAVAAVLEIEAGAAFARVLVRPGDEVERVRAGGRAGGAVSERCRWVWV